MRLDARCVRQGQAARRHPNDDLRAPWHGGADTGIPADVRDRTDEPLPTVVDRLRSSVEKEYLRRVLRKYRGHMGKVSKHAGLNRRTLYNKMQVYGINRDDFR